MAAHVPVRAGDTARPQTPARPTTWKPPDADVLAGREAEVALLRSVLVSAVAGRASVLVLAGEPGTGKSALLAWAAAQAKGWTVVRISGVPAESSIAFAGLFDILRPFTARIERLPAHQAVVLREVLGIAPPRHVDRLALHGAVLALLCLVSAQTPVLLTVDDAGWLDQASQEALAFVLRRLEGEAVVCLLAGRPEQLALFARSHLPWLELGFASDPVTAKQPGSASVSRPSCCWPTVSLTPAEFHVASLVARGATNREVAVALFLSPKTVDHHLGRVYAKLGLRSRTELAHLMATSHDWSGHGPGGPSGPGGPGGPGAERGRE